MIIIPGELTDLNTYIHALNSCRWSGNKIKQEETERCAWAAKMARCAFPACYPVKITYRWFSKDNRKDIDNVAFAKKFINDGLVIAGVLPKDSRKFIAGFADEFYIDKENPRTEIIIETI